METAIGHDTVPFPSNLISQLIGDEGLRRLILHVVMDVCQPCRGVDETLTFALCSQQDGKVLMEEKEICVVRWSGGWTALHIAAGHGHLGHLGQIRNLCFASHILCQPGVVEALLAGKAWIFSSNSVMQFFRPFKILGNVLSLQFPPFATTIATDVGGRGDNFGQRRPHCL